jgi:hypothetical protein
MPRRSIQVSGFEECLEAFLVDRQAHYVPKRPRRQLQQVRCVTQRVLEAEPAIGDHFNSLKPQWRVKRLYFPRHQFLPMGLNSHLVGLITS